MRRNFQSWHNLLKPHPIPQGHSDILTFVWRVYAVDGYLESPTYKLQKHVVAKCIGGHYVVGESAEALWDAVVALVEIHEGINGV